MSDFKEKIPRPIFKFLDAIKSRANSGPLLRNIPILGFVLTEVPPFRYLFDNKYTKQLSARGFAIILAIFLLGLPGLLIAAALIATGKPGKSDNPEVVITVPSNNRPEDNLNLFKRPIIKRNPSITNQDKIDVKSKSNKVKTVRAVI